MRKLAWLLLFVWIVTLLAGQPAGAANGPAAELGKISKYIKYLDKQIKLAKKKKNTKKVKQLTILKKKQLVRAAEIKYSKPPEDEAGAELAPIVTTPETITTTTLTPTTTTTTTMPAPKVRKGEGWMVEGGYAGGGATLGLEYLFPISGDVLQLKLGGGYGQGSNYNFLFGRLGGQLVLPGELLAGAYVDGVNYSMRVHGITGLTLDQAKGFSFAGGGFVGKRIDCWTARLGFSFVMGVSAGVEYAF